MHRLKWERRTTPKMTSWSWSKDGVSGRIRFQSETLCLEECKMRTVIYCSRINLGLWSYSSPWPVICWHMIPRAQISRYFNEMTLFRWFHAHMGPREIDVVYSVTYVLPTWVLFFLILCAAYRMSLRIMKVTSNKQILAKVKPSNYRYGLIKPWIKAAKSQGARYLVTKVSGFAVKSCWVAADLC